MKKSFNLIVYVSIMSFLSGCVDLAVRSVWKENEIIVDGKDTDWNRTLVKEKNVAFGVCNDAESLYLCFSITDKMTKAQMLGLFRQDLYIWFETNEKNSRKYGIRLQNNSAFMNEALLAKTRYMPVQSFQVIADEMMQHLNVDVLQNYAVIPLSEAKGISVGFGISDNGRRLIYEIIVPLNSTPGQPFAINSIPDKPLYVFLETSPIDTIMLSKQLGLYDNYGMNDEMGMTGGARGAGQGMPVYYSRKYIETEMALEKFVPVKICSKIVLAKRPER